MEDTSALKALELVSGIFRDKLQDGIDKVKDPAEFFAYVQTTLMTIIGSTAFATNDISFISDMIRAMERVSYNTFHTLKEQEGNLSSILKSMQEGGK